MNIGITGESGFIGRRLAAAVERQRGMRRVAIERGWLDGGCGGDAQALAAAVGRCDVVVHLAAKNRPTDDPAVFQTNVRLTGALIRALEQTDRQPVVIFASSIREGEATAYGQSKKVCRQMLETWAAGRGEGSTAERAAEAASGAEGGKRSGARNGRRGEVISLRIPNVFGQGAKPFDNSFIATFGWQLAHGAEPVVSEDRIVPLVDVGSLCEQIISVIGGQGRDVREDCRMSVAEVLGMLRGFWEEFGRRGGISVPKDPCAARLRDAFMSYLPR